MKKNLLVFLLFYLISCRHSDKILFELDPSSLLENEIMLSDIADDIVYIPLKCSFPLSQINSNYNPKICNNKIFIYDVHEGILEFDINGQFLMKIGKKGRGPGEYFNGRSFAIDKRTGTIYVSNEPNGIKVFNITGTFRNEFSLKAYGGSLDKIEVFNSRLFLSYQLQYDDDNKFEWIILDTLGNLIKKKERTLPAFKSNFLNGGGTYLFDDKLNFWNPFIDTVYTFYPDFTLRPNFLFKQGEFRLPKTYIDNPIKQLHKYFMINQIFESKKYLMIQYLFYKEKNGLVIIDKNLQNTFLSYWSSDDTGCIWNDLDAGLKFFPKTFIADHGREYLIDLIDPYKLKACVSGVNFKKSEPKYPEKKKKLEKLANSLKETDNPVLVLVNLK